MESAAAPIVILKLLLSEPPLLVAVTVKLYVPAAVGVPVIVPSLFKVRPGGVLPPAAALHVQEVGSP